MSIDASELGRLASDLNTVAIKSAVVARAVVQKGALNIKTDWRARWTGHAHLPQLPSAVTYDTTEGPWGAEAEIGVDKAKPQGPLGSLIEYGSSNSAPMPGGAPALAVEAPKFEKALLDGVARLL